MIEVLAKQSVAIKCNFDDAILTGKYELSYALGIITAIAGIAPLDQYEDLHELLEYVKPHIKEISVQNERINRLIDKIQTFETTDWKADVQTSQLYMEGCKSKSI